MPGPATYADDVNVAERARAKLDGIAASVEVMDAAQRAVVGQLIELWPISGWLAAGVRSAKQWLHAHTGQSWNEAERLTRIAELCSRDEPLAAAVVDGRFPLGWADTLSRAVSDERARFLTDKLVDSLIGLAEAGVEDAQFNDVVRYWKERADELLKPRRVQDHSLVASQRLFGGGEIHASLAPAAFETVMCAIDAFCADPDPVDAPYQRTLSERRADALDDLATYGLTHGGPDDDTCSISPDDEDAMADDTFDGMCDTDLLDELLDDDDGYDESSGDGYGDDVECAGDDECFGDDGDERPERPAHRPDPARPDTDDILRDLDGLRRRLAKQEKHRRRRARRQTRPRSGARVNAHIDLLTLAGLRDIDDIDGLVLRGEGWNLTRTAAEQLLCDSTLVATLFAGRRILDANADAELFSKRQRRAIAARDRCCVFPGCSRPPKHCDAHHLWERDDGGPTIVANGCLLCRFHHRLIHQYQWKLRMDDDGVWIATDPHGTDYRQRKPTHSDAA